MKGLDERIARQAPEERAAQALERNRLIALSFPKAEA